MNIPAWIIFGAIAGLVSHVIDPGETKGSIIGSTILGVLGAVVGGFFANLIFGIGSGDFNLPAFLVAILGALLLLFIGKALAAED